ncbi:MAG: tRNA (adenosine(37)-N6)-threonylcarbamoyltransferase complex ATPase subunit type 1 TsaE [Desulfovibrio sp.]|nr:tRNA (adenosine(37)-N6)-threonylcarbamoyltransferase complex ATPase subunit type 1 TsaE [Desulfovibrio sp.]
MARVRLKNLEDTGRFGRLLAELLPASGVRALLLRGGLGSGKTTLTAALVRALPGGDEAEVSSPSFTLCNIYPTTPALVHCDLYRSPGHAPEELTNALDADDALTVVEWADSLDASLLPEDFLDISFEMEDDARLLLLKGGAPRGEALAAALARAWPEGAPGTGH